MLVCMSFSVLAAAQSVDYEYKQKFIVKDKKTGREIVTNFLAASAEDVTSYDGMDDETKAKRFGKEWKGGALILTLDNSVKLMSFTDFCKKNKLNNKRLMVLNGRFYSDTTTANVLFDSSRITSFEQKKDSIFIHMNFNKRN